VQGQGGACGAASLHGDNGTHERTVRLKGKGAASEVRPCRLQPRGVRPLPHGAQRGPAVVSHAGHLHHTLLGGGVQVARHRAAGAYTRSLFSST